MTRVAHHLLCDCKKAVNAVYCPVSILKPTVENQYDYYKCTHCDNDYICDHSIKVEFSYDDKGLPEKNIIVCQKCGTPVEVNSWPTPAEELYEGEIYQSIYKERIITGFAEPKKQYYPFTKEIIPEKYIGNSYTLEFHKPDCSWVSMMKEENKAVLSSVDEAQNKGYNGCHWCLREYDTGK